MKRLPETHGVPVVRTTFLRPERWQEAVVRLTDPEDDTFIGNFTPVDDADFDGVSIDEILSALDAEYRAAKRVIVVFDSESESGPDSPLLAVDLRESGRYSRFRLTPEAAHTFEMNIATSNMDFIEYARWAEEHDGLHSGF